MNLLVDHVSFTTPRTSSDSLQQLTRLSPSLVLSLMELILSASLPIPQSTRASKDFASRLTLAKLLLGLLLDDLLPSVHRPDVDSALTGGAVGFALDCVDPRRFAEGAMSGEEARAVASAVWEVAKGKGWREVQGDEDVSLRLSAVSSPEASKDSTGLEDDAEMATIQYHDSSLATIDPTLSPMTTSSALASLTLSMHSEGADTVADDVTVTGSFTRAGEREAARGANARRGWNEYGLGGEGGDARGSDRAGLGVQDKTESEGYCSCSDTEEGDGYGHADSTPRAHSHPDARINATADTIDIPASSFSRSLSSIPIRYDGWLGVVDLAEELRSFEMARGGAAVALGRGWVSFEVCIRLDGLDGSLTGALLQRAHTHPGSHTAASQPEPHPDRHRDHIGVHRGRGRQPSTRPRHGLHSYSNPRLTHALLVERAVLRERLAMFACAGAMNPTET